MKNEFQSWKVALLLFFWSFLSSCHSLFEYFPSSPKSISAVLKTTLSDEDFLHSKVKILPDDQDVVFQLRFGQRVKLVYPIPRKGPISIIISPCTGALKWSLVWRPHTLETVDVIPVDEEASAEEKTTEYTRNAKEWLRKKSLLRNITLMDQPKSKKSLVTRRIRKRRDFGSKIVANNFSISLAKYPSRSYVFSTTNRAILQVALSKGNGKDPWHFEKESVLPGLYIVQIEAISHRIKFHALASRNPTLQETIKSSLKALKPKDPSVKHSIRLTWTTSSHDVKLFCLTVSKHKMFSSLCAAREIQNQWRTAVSPAVDSSMILGCTTKNYYNFPATLHVKYFVTIWKDNSLIPLVQATVKAKPQRKTTRLKSGVIAPFSLKKRGQAVAKFHVRKPGKKLHIIAVSCFGGIKVQVSAGKTKIATSRGREIIHMLIRRVPQAKLTIKVTPHPPLHSIYRINLVVAHSARRLPIPRLPKSVSVYSSPINCTAATIQWTRAPGGPDYCVIFQLHPSGHPPEIRHPIQCGWEQIIKRRDYFQITECFNATHNGHHFQQRTIVNLQPQSSFLVNVLVRHAGTGNILALEPSMLTIPSCQKPNIK